IAVGGQRFDAEHAQTDAESVARQRAGERGVGLRITAHRQQRLHQQHRPFFIADLVTNRLFCGANAVGVIAAEKHLAALLQISRGGGADEQKEAEGDKLAEGWRRSECFIAAKHDDIYAKPLNDASFALEKSRVGIRALSGQGRKFDDVCCAQFGLGRKEPPPEGLRRISVLASLLLGHSPTSGDAPSSRLARTENRRNKRGRIYETGY